MKARIKLLIILTVLAVIAGCAKPKPEAIGSFNAVFAFVDPQEADLLKEPLELAIEHPIKTPRPEKLFRIIWGDTNTFDDATRHHIVLIAASIKSPGWWGAFVRRNLDKKAYEGVKKGQFNVFRKKDPWARNQILIILTARNADELRAFILTNMDLIFEMINNYCNEQVSQWLFGKYQGKGERKDLERKIAEEYGFGIRVPRMFEWEKGTPKERFLWLRALDPERWVFVYWEPLDSTQYKKISLSWLVRTRDSLCLIYYEGDSLMKEELTYRRIYFRNLPGIKYRARWKNVKKVIGGPVVGYVLDDIEHKRRYILDGAVFAPGVRKEPYLRHCELIMLSFNPDARAFLDSLNMR
ncbi:MAG TPA: DUF4837 family protein [candidate division Zixibacteria bacterium]|nr:DUF4837 family protein [candidate division Zixibacteria bacterium]